MPLLTPVEVGAPCHDHRAGQDPFHHAGLFSQRRAVQSGRRATELFAQAERMAWAETGGHAAEIVQ